MVGQTHLAHGRMKALQAGQTLPAHGRTKAIQVGQIAQAQANKLKNNTLYM